MNSPIDYLVLTASMLSALPYLCRLDGLKIGVHKTTVVVFHMFLFIGCISAGHNAFYGKTTLGDVAIVFVAWLWIYISHFSWPVGPPEHVIRPQSADKVMQQRASRVFREHE